MVQSVPIRDVRFQVTHACNHRCPHCFSSSGTVIDNELTVDEARDMIKQLADMGMKLFTFTGGEPLLRKDFVEPLVEYLNELGVYSRLFTNGYLLTDKLALKLKDLGLNELQVSIDGLQPTHDKFRKTRSSFEHAVSALNYANVAGLNTFVRITVIPQNVNELPRLIEFLENLEIKGIRIRPFVSVGRGKENREYILDTDDFKIAFSYLAKKRRESKTSIQLLSPSFPFLYDEGIDSELLTAEFKGKGCSCGSELCAISPDGNLKACGYFSNILGNVKEHSIAEMWAEQEFVCKLRSISGFNEFCMKCKYLDLCGGGCRASAYENLGTFEAPDPLCPLYNDALKNGKITEEGQLI